MSSPRLNHLGNVAYVHQLKCWAESFDAIADGSKRAEVRSEDDRRFKAGDLLELLRTDTTGKPTSPETRIVIEVLHVERHAGPLELHGHRAGDAGGLAVTPLVVLSLHHRFERHSYAPPAPAAVK